MRSGRYPAGSPCGLSSRIRALGAGAGRWAQRGAGCSRQLTIWVVYKYPALPLPRAKGNGKVRMD